jgi:DNA-binding winged helix-turn-helix (wHTH) protein/tetratricopeptide (TPR) repeat protein
MRYRFAGLEFDPQRGLERTGTLIPLPAQERRLLGELLAGGGEVVTKEALVDSVWRGGAISDDSISRAVFRLRRVLAEVGADKVVATVYGGGFRIAVPVTRLDRADAIARPPAASSRPSPAVRECLQTAREFVGRRGLQDMVAATLATRRAVRIDPRCVEAWVLLAQISALRIFRGQFDARQIVIRRARHALRRALAIDPDASAALAQLGWIVAILDGQVAEGLSLVDRALALDGADWLSHNHRAWVLHAACRPDEGLGAFEAALHCHPLAAFVPGPYGYALGCHGHVAKAYAVLDRAIRQMPTVDSLLSARSSVAAMAGDLDRALRDARRCAEISPDAPNQLYAHAYALAAQGATDDARCVLDRMTSARTQLAPSWLAVVLAGLGEQGAAADALNRARRERCPWLALVQYDPRLRDILPAEFAGHGHQAVR